MACKRSIVMIFIALCIGALMVTTFLGGQHLIARDYRFIGTFLTAWAFLVWPLYALFATFGVHRLGLYFKGQSGCIERRTAWRRSIYWVPLGAIFAILVMDVLLS